MPIINTKDKSFLRLILSLALLLSLGVSPGCAQKDRLHQAQEYVSDSDSYYRKAQAEYQALLRQGKDPDKINLELGRLYFDHGAFQEAVGCFSKSGIPEAKKFLAITLYRTGDFTSALEAFNKLDSPDAEYLYYKGLTCEKLNLFDQALKEYSQIKDKRFSGLAQERIDVIQRLARPRNIKEVSPKIASILANAPKEELYPQAGALILFCDERIAVTKEFTEVSDLHYLIKILNERGKQDFAEAKVEYDSTYEKIELEYARTIKPDGTIVDVGTRHIRDVSKYLNFPLYSNAHVYIISFPEVAQGTSVEYKLKIYRNKLINDKDFVIPYTVQTIEPIISADFTVSFPKGTSVSTKLLNEKYNYFKARMDPQKEESSGIVFYRWHFKDIPQIIPESNMPPQVEINPTAMISSFKGWDDLYGWWWKLARDKIQADPSIKEKVKALIAGFSSDDEKARAIYNFCAREIRYVAVEYGQAGYEPHQAADIFRNKYGDCKDQAILLVTMLKEAGLKAWPVLISTKEYYNLSVDFPSMLFNHCIACLRIKDRLIFMDPTAETCPFGDLPDGDQRRRVFVCREDGYEIADTPLFDAAHNQVRQVTRLKIAEDESVAGEKDIRTYGVYDQGQRYWLLYTQPELIEAQLKEKIQDISIGAKLLNYKIYNLDDLNKPVELEYSFSGPEYFTVAGNLRIMPQLTSLDTSLVAKEKRVYPMDFVILDSKETSYEIKLPPQTSVKYLPDNVEEDSPWMDFSLSYSQKGDVLTFLQKARMKKDTVAESEYADFKKFYEALAKKIKQRVVLEKRK